LDPTQFGAETNYLFPSHTHWFVRFISTDNTSHYTAGVGSPTTASTDPIFSRMDVVRTLLFGTAQSPANWVHQYILIPAVNLWFFLLSLFETHLSWFEPWPVYAALRLLSVILISLGILLCMWLRAWREVFARVGHHAHSFLLAIVFFLWTVLATSATAAAVVTIFVVPYDLHLSNDVDAALMSAPAPEVRIRALMFGALILALYFPVCLCVAMQFSERRRNQIPRDDSSPEICSDSTKNEDTTLTEV